MKSSLLILLFFIFSLSDLGAQSYVRTSSFLFSFPEGSDLLEEDCGDNRSMLLRMEEELSSVRNRIEAGNYHLLIVAHVSAFNYSNTGVVNKASRNAGYLRAYIKSNIGIPSECMAFYIDRSGDYRDKVHVYLVRSLLPVYANKEICFSDEDDLEAMQKEIARYGGVPYVNLYRKGEAGGYRREVYVINDPLFDRTELDDYRLAIPVAGQKKEPVAAVAKAVTPQAAPVAKNVTTKPTTAQPAPQDKTVKKTAGPRWGVSTNLLYWAALTPNLMLEGYFGNAFSFHIEGVYADWQTKGRDPKTWSVWEVSPELRYWFWGKDYRFTGHYVGLYGHLGDFDFMFNTSHGFVGSYKGGGLSYGYVFPLNRTLLMELGVRAGFVRVEYDSYYYEHPAYYKDAPHEKNYVGPTGAHVSLIYRF